MRLAGQRELSVVGAGTVRSRPRQNCAGAFLIEALVYIAAFMVILTLAFGALHHTMLAHKSIRHSAEDIALALQVGEQWRADVRQAVQPFESTSSDGFERVRIPTREGVVTYRFANATVTRSTSVHTNEIPVLRNVRSCKVSLDRRESVTAWRWELELQSTRKRTRIRPLFTFIAVPETQP